jgi:3-hydroxyisobutyrate dehydrogenase-like beta-hydroxyacid dehydrogenase
MTGVTRIVLIGLGEVGAILATDLLASRGTARSLAAVDPKMSDPQSAPFRTAHNLEIAAEAAFRSELAGADLFISAVTAAQTLRAAEAAADFKLSGGFYLDLNSSSPSAKMDAARAITAAGGRYVEAAVMSPVPPKRLGTSILLGGPEAAAFLPHAEALGLTGAKIFSTELGQASAAKMCRSVVVKGIEALLSESLLSARRYRVEDAVLDSLSDLFPGPDWPVLSRYMISRTLEHGQRRAEEMREAARTVAEAGIEPHMASATAARQDWASAYAAALSQEALPDMLDAIRALAGPPGKAQTP